MELVNKWIVASLIYIQIMDSVNEAITNSFLISFSSIYSFLLASESSQAIRIGSH